MKIKIYIIVFFLFLKISSQAALTSELYKFAVIGDFGSGNSDEEAVAKLVKSWNPKFIITVGDNNYDEGAEKTIDSNIGKYYADYIGNYMGKYGSGANKNKFFPSLGNHDWYTKGAEPYLDYFTLPGNERYYDFIKGPIHFFVLDSDENEPDGININSKQYKWFENEIKKSNKKFKIVYFHHAPYTSGAHGSTLSMKWPFEKLGVNFVLSGHDHDYERISVNGLQYVVVGTGGKELRKFKKIIPESKVRYSGTFGALRGKVYKDKIIFEFYSVKNVNKPLDTFTIDSNPENIQNNPLKVLEELFNNLLNPHE